MSYDSDDRLQLIVPVPTRDGQVWITQHAVDRFAEREQSVRRGDAQGQRRLVSLLRTRMKGGRIQLTRPAVPVTGDEDGYLVTGAYVWPLASKGDEWVALTTIGR